MKSVQCYDLFGGIALKNNAFFNILLLFYFFKHIGHVGRISVSGYSVRHFTPQLNQYAESLSKTFHLHCLANEHQTGTPSFSAMSFLEETTLTNQRIFYENGLVRLVCILSLVIL